MKRKTRKRKLKRPRRPKLPEEAREAPSPSQIRFANQVLDTELPPNLDDWELSEGGLPEGSTLLGSKALVEEYSEDEANSKKTKNTNTGKGKKGNPKPKE